jgi:hypothetical protein
MHAERIGIRNGARDAFHATALAHGLPTEPAAADDDHQQRALDDLEVVLAQRVGDVDDDEMLQVEDAARLVQDW